MTSPGDTSVSGRWPEDGLESVAQCPACGNRERRRLHEDLRDEIFRCAPGAWTLYGCLGCSTAYLDPRPTPGTIGLAYETYFTHGEDPDFESLGTVARFWRRLANGYRNRRFGTRDYPASTIGALVFPLVPPVKSILDAGMRHLEPPPPGGRLLDVGCGNGRFLLRAQSAGWRAVGVDFDARAVQAARKLGLDVRVGGVETLVPDDGLFDVITMSHVIEHVHDPQSVLNSCLDLLQPGGVLWLETPNSRAFGHETFGRHWRGLEPPRHLAIFSPAALRQVLADAGFSRVEAQPYRRLCREVFGASAAIAAGVDPYSDSRPKVAASLVRKAEKLARREPERREFITLKAMK